MANDAGLSSRLLPVRKHFHAVIWWQRHRRGRLRVPELELLKPLIEETDVCADVGAHAGSWLVPLARWVKRGHVYGFEALPYYADVLKLMIRLMRLRNVTVVGQAVTEHRGRAQLVWKDVQGRRLTGFTHVAGATEEKGGVLEVESGSLDEYFAQERRRIRLIKVDVEGAEVGVFRGADAVLRRFRPLVYTELVNAYLERYGHTTADVFRIFKGLDYRTFRIVDGPALLPVSGQADELGNDVLFVPSELEAETLLQERMRKA